MKTITKTFRTTDEIVEKCDKVAEYLCLNRNQFINVVLERVCDQVIKEMGNNGKRDKQY